MTRTTVSLHCDECGDEIGKPVAFVSQEGRQITLEHNGNSTEEMKNILREGERPTRLVCEKPKCKERQRSLMRLRDNLRTSDRCFRGGVPISPSRIW